MDAAEIFSHIDHTLLKADSTWPQIEKLCAEAQRYGAAAVCIPPCYVRRVKEAFPALPVSTVVGFPLGYAVTEAKLTETRQALADGADEIDMVINICDVKNGDYFKVQDEIDALKRACGDKALKVIVETCYLTREEKIALCRAVEGAGADYIKTSTGFGSAGADVADVALFRSQLPSHIRIKAAGGIRDRKTMEALLRAGADRLGCSAGVSALYPDEA